MYPKLTLSRLAIFQIGILLMTLTLTPWPLCGDREQTPGKQPVKISSDEPTAIPTNRKDAPSDSKNETIDENAKEAKPTAKSTENSESDKSQGAPSITDQPTKPDDQTPERKERSDPRPRFAAKPKKSKGPKIIRMKTWRKSGLKSSTKTP